MSISLNTTSNKKPHFWVREKSQSSAEVDLIMTNDGLAFPIEIKSGAVGKLKSLHQFIGRAPHHYAVRMYVGEFSVEVHTTIQGKRFKLMNLPYYLGTQIYRYLHFFKTNY